MKNRASESLRVALLGVRDLLVTAGPLLLLAVAVLVAAYWWLDPQPPKSVRLATGPTDSAYANFGDRYAKALAPDGIEVKLTATEGAQDNLNLLREGKVEIGFVRGGADENDADEEAGLTSLGSLFYEPIWVFYRKDLVKRLKPKAGELTLLSELKGLKVNIGTVGSGVPQIMEKLLGVNGMKLSDLQVENLENGDAVAQLQAGRLDAAVIVSAQQSRGLRALLRDPAVALMPFDQNEAYSRRLPFLSAVSLPRGVVDLAADLPPRDVSLLATTTSLITRDDTHPALRQRFAQVAQGIHSRAGWFNGTRDFPNTKTSELPVAPEGDRAINGTPPIWQRYLPFWASNLLERMWLVITGLLVLMLPLSRIVPPLYTYRVRSRVFRWYERLRVVEDKIEARQGSRQALLDELEALERLTNRIAVPLSHADELYGLRNNIHAVRKRLLARWPA
jgi:TRAP transporter TAXI family solute receptor